MEPLYLLLIGIPLAGILVYAAYDFCSARKRSADIKRWAEQRGFEFYPAAKDTFLDELHGFQLFSKGYIRKVKNHIVGEIEGIEFSIFDYEYTVLSKRAVDIRSSVQTVFLIRLSKLALPFFSLWPRSFYRKLAGKSGSREFSFEAREACFESDLPFSKNYLVYGNDECSVQGVFSNKLLAWLGEHPGLRMDGGDDRFIIYRSGKKIKAKAIPAFLDEGMRLEKLLQENEGRS